MNTLLEKFKSMGNKDNPNANVNEGLFDSLLSDKIYNLDDIDDLLDKIVDSDRYYNNLDTNIDTPSTDSITFKFYFIKKDKPINLNISCSPDSIFKGYFLDILSKESLDKFTNKGFYSRYVNADNDIKDIISKCDTKRIYNIYSPVAINILRDYFIQAYLLFNSDNIVKTCINQSTLSVSYSSQFDKFIYRYNPNFILETAMYEYINSPDSYKCRFKNAYVYTLAFLICHEMMHLITNNVTVSGLNSIVNLDSGANRTDNIVTDSFINCSLSRIFARVPIIRSRDNNGYAPLLTVGINSEFQFRNQLGKGFKKFKDSKELLDSIIHILVKYSQNTLSTDNFDCTRSLKTYIDTYLSEIVGCDFLGKINVPASYTNIRSSSAYFQRFITEIVRVFTDGEIYSMDAQLTEKEQVEDLSRDKIPEGTLVRVANTMDICYVHKGEIYNIDQYTKSMRYHLTMAKRVGVNKEPVDKDKKLYLCSYAYEDTKEPYNNDIPIDFSQLIILDNENTWYESEDVVDSDKEADKEKLSKEDLDKARDSYNSIVAYVCDKYFGDTWVFSEYLIDIISNGITLNKYTDSELKVLSAYKNKINSQFSTDKVCEVVNDDIIGNNRDNDYCIKILGKYTVDKIIDYADKKSYEELDDSDDEKSNDVIKSILDNPAVKKLMQSKEAQEIMKNLNDFYNMGKDSNKNTDKVLGVGSIVYIRSLNLFGRIVNINQDGTYSIEECKESPSIILDDSDKDRGVSA